VGEDRNVPLVVTACGFHDGSLPTLQSLVRVEQENVRLPAIKMGEDGEGVVLRLVEAEGKACQARVALAEGLCPAGAKAVEVDTLERSLPENGARIEDGILLVNLPAYGIATVRIGA
jgi:alpha-mannosidase